MKYTECVLKAKKWLVLLPKWNLKRRSAISYDGKPQFRPNVLTNKWRQSQYGLVGFQNELALGVGWKALVQQQDPWTVCWTGQIPARPPSQAGWATPTISDVAHLDAEGELVAWVGGKSKSGSDFCRSESLVKTCCRGENLTEIRGKLVFGSSESWGGTLGRFLNWTTWSRTLRPRNKKITVRPFQWNALVTKD